MADRTSGAEQLIAIPGRGVGAASEEVVRIAERRGYGVGASGPGTFRLVKSSRPKWAIAAAAISAPLLGLGLLFLLIRRTQSTVVTVFEDRTGTKARIVGDLDPGIVEYLQAPTQARPPSAPRLSGPAQPPDRASDLLANKTVEIPPGTEPPESLGIPDAAAVGQVPATITQSGPPDGPDLDLAETMVRPGRPNTNDRPPAVLLPDGRVIDLGLGIVVGRSPDPGGTDGDRQVIQLHDPTLSKTHLSICPDGTAVVVTDLHSTNGTRMRVGGTSVVCRPGVQSSVPPGAEILAGEAVIKVLGQQ